MKKEQFGQLAAEVVENLKANKVTIKPSNDSEVCVYFNPLQGAENKEAQDKGFFVNGTLYRSGMMQICITVNLDEDDMACTFKKMRARSIITEACSKKMESEELATEADKLLTKAAGILGIPVADVEKIVVTETED